MPRATVEMRAPRDGLCSSSRRGAPPHDWRASIDSPARSVGATVASPVPSDPRSRATRCEYHSVDTTRAVAHRRASRDERPRAHRPTCNPAPIARDRASAAPAADVPAYVASLDPDRERAICRFAVALRRHDPKLQQPENPRTIASRSHSSSLVGSTPRRRHRIVRCQVGSRSQVQAAEQTAHPTAVRAGGRVITSNRYTQDR